MRLPWCLVSPPEAGQTPWHSKPPSPAEAFIAAPVVLQTPSDGDTDCQLPADTKNTLLCSSTAGSKSDCIGCSVLHECHISDYHTRTHGSIRVLAKPKKKQGGIIAIGGSRGISPDNLVFLTSASM